MPPAAKRQKKNEDHLICPINLNLPLDPVVADDGQVYERAAIEQYIKNNPGGELKSPITREKMGTKLMVALHVKNTIETMIENGAITGEPAEDWKERMEQTKKMKDLLKEAEGGDVGAMIRVADGYNWAKYGFKEDHKLAYKWYDKARVAESVYGMAKVGEFLVRGIGVTKDVTKGIMYLGMAAGMGSALGSYILGNFLSDGLHGTPVDKVEACILLEKSLSGNCPHQPLTSKGKRLAQNILDRIVNERA